MNQSLVNGRVAGTIAPRRATSRQAGSRSAVRITGIMGGRHLGLVILPGAIPWQPALLDQAGHHLATAQVARDYGVGLAPPAQPRHGCGVGQPPAAPVQYLYQLAAAAKAGV